MESFGGIGGLRRALEILGVTPALYLHAEIDEGANRVVQSNYPDQVSLGDVTQITEVQLRKVVRDYPLIEHVLHGYGPPCQNVTGLNAMGAGVSGAKSKLVDEVPRLRDVIRRVFPDCKHADMCEMVASLVREDQAHYDDLNGQIPVRICPSGFASVRRPRLWWLTWALTLGDDVTVEVTDRWTTLHLHAERMPLRRWLPQGWKVTDSSVTFPTFVRAQKRKKPPFKPAGIQVLKRHELKRYKDFQFIFPPYQFQDKYMVENRAKVKRPPTAEMREVLMGYPKDYTHAVMNATDRRKSAEDFDLARSSLIGNAWHAGTAAWIVSHLLAEWGILSRPATVAEVADPGVATGLKIAVPGTDVELIMAEAEINLVRMYLGRQSHRGGEVTWLAERSAGKSTVPPGINANEWLWRDIISTRWVRSGEHINVLECRALVLALRWRFRQVVHIGTRCLHLVDSKVTLGVVAKGRTSSWRMRRVLGKVNALLMSAHGTIALGFVRTHLNPADRPSRREGRTSKDMSRRCGLPCEHPDCQMALPERPQHSGRRCQLQTRHPMYVPCSCGQHYGDDGATSSSAADCGQRHD